MFAALVALCSTAQAVLPQTGWWWNPQEGGSGLNLQFQRTVDGGVFMFAAGFVYDESGNPVWFTTDGPVMELNVDEWNETGFIAQFSGARAESEGGSCLTCPYVTPTTVVIPGSEVQFDFSDTRLMEATFDGFTRSYQFFDVSNGLATGLDVLDGTRAYVSAGVFSGMVNGSVGALDAVFTDTKDHTVQAAIRRATPNEAANAIVSDSDDELFIVETANNDGEPVTSRSLILNSFDGVSTLQLVSVALVLTYDRETETAQMVFAQLQGNRLDLVNSFDNFPRLRAFVTEDAIIGYAIPPLIGNWQVQDRLNEMGFNITLGSNVVIYRTKQDDVDFMVRN